MPLTTRPKRLPPSTILRGQNSTDTGTRTHTYHPGCHACIAIYFENRLRVSEGLPAIGSSPWAGDRGVNGTRLNYIGYRDDHSILVNSLALPGRTPYQAQGRCPQSVHEGLEPYGRTRKRLADLLNYMDGQGWGWRHE